MQTSTSKLLGVFRFEKQAEFGRKTKGKRGKEEMRRMTMAICMMTRGEARHLKPSTWN
jgi:hypothetical protein